MIRIGLIGGGPTAAALMESLHRSRKVIDPGVRLDVTVFDPTPHPWCGHSFSPDRPEALSNAPTEEMSLRHWEPDHASAWFEANGYANFTGFNFAPRPLMGRYFQESAQHAAERMEVFALVKEEAISVLITEDQRVRVNTSTREETFDYVILCMGHSGGVDRYKLTGHEKFCVTPYPLKDALSAADPDEHIGIIGCGLTAVDVVLALRADKHRGPITLMSRRGLLPVVRRSPRMHQLQKFTSKAVEGIFTLKGKVSLEELFHLACMEFDCAGARWQTLAAEIDRSDFGVDRLRYQMSRIHDDEISRVLAIMWAMTAISFQDAWYFLDHPGKSTFAAKFQYIYNNFCCPMPQDRAAAILELADSGQLKVVRGLQSVSKNERGGFVAVFGNASPLQFDRAIQAAVDVNKVHSMAAPLVSLLLQSGQAAPHHFGGLCVERMTSRLLDVRGRQQPQLYAAGTTTGGAFQFLNGLALLRSRTSQISDSILTHCQNRPLSFPSSTASSPASDSTLGRASPAGSQGVTY